MVLTEITVLPFFFKIGIFSGLTKITRMGDSIMLSQEHYFEKILKRFGHFDAKPVSTPYDANTHLMKN